MASSSSHKSAFDFLMSNAHAAVSKKKTPPQTSNCSRSPSKKMKVEEESVNPESPKTLAPISRVSKLKSKIVLLKKKPSDFDPEEVSCWEKGERVPFMFLSLAFDLISVETGRIVITDILCNMLRTVIATTPEDLLPTVYLAANEIAPAHEGVKLGIGKGSSIIKAISEAFGRTEAQVEQQNKKLGDLGLVARGSRSTQTMIFMPKPLTVVKVADTLKKIAKESGNGSKDKKKDIMKSLLVATTDCEPLYLTRLLQGNLRLGFSRQTVLAALGQAAVYNEQHSKPPPNTKNPLDEAAKIVKEVFSVLPVYDIIVDALLTSGVWNLPNTCKFTPGVPVRPMLANPTTSIGVILNKLGDTAFTCEYKYDGERAQIHYMEDGTLEIFSKSSERYTEKYPDVVLALSRLKKPSVTSYILDCEIVAFDREKKKLLPFQKLSTRAHKNVNINDIKVGVCIFGFDMLYLNGQLLIQENLNTRRERLYDSFEEDPGIFQFATTLTSSDVGEIQEFLEASVNDGFGDSLDLVPIAASYGEGNRAGVFGSFLVACYDDVEEELQSIANIGTGFSESKKEDNGSSDLNLEELSLSLRSKIIATPKENYRVDGLKKEPDVWFEPTEVWEVKAADLTISSVYRAAYGIACPNKGISLRFPRVLRVRKDKKPEEATTSVQIAEMYQAQKNIQLSNEANSDDY
ncbi:unnamed protein product [Microthlaspi erraticum]|uniref:DNA ligase n=1 Tax=Microthlaspi erraticum TaxID=1685480 RepID=A0A6D2IHI8_9BRAS|nr:unnamed protein product [Microthlaspi erraticum]